MVDADQACGEFAVIMFSSFGDLLIQQRQRLLQNAMDRPSDEALT